MAHLEMLGIHIDVEPSRVYHDDGFVDSIEAHNKRLRERYNINISTIQEYEYYKDCIGQHSYITKEGRVYHHIYYLDRNPASNIQVRGHEETHALDAFGRLDLLEQRLLDEQGYKINLNKIKDDEVIAYIGGIYSLLKEGISKRTLHKIHFHKKFEEAIKILESSSVSRKTLRRTLTSLLYR